MLNKQIKVWSFALGALFLAAGFFTRGFGIFSVKSGGLIPEGANDFLSILLSEITNEAKWYEYESGSTRIRFFAVLAKDGSVKTAFDACDVCYAEKKGYRQEGDYMVCNNCGNSYPINGLGTENKTPGGCWPGYLPNIIEGENMLIKKSDLESNKWRFL